jgi:hypothetical protein
MKIINDDVHGYTEPHDSICVKYITDRYPETGDGTHKIVIQCKEYKKCRYVSVLFCDGIPIHFKGGIVEITHINMRDSMGREQHRIYEGDRESSHHAQSIA